MEASELFPGNESMAQLSDLKLKYRLYMQAYSYRRIDWRPSAQLRKPLSESKIAVVTSAAFYAPGQETFDPSVRGGDYSYRQIPDGMELASLRIGHKSDAFDHAGIEKDKNLALPLDRLRELKQAGLVGDVAKRHYSLMGSITAPGRLVQTTAPEIARKLAEDGVDAVLLTPV
jgi:D-proline reductase (dithiol) PrdB